MKSLFWFVAIALSLPPVAISPKGAIAQPVGTIQCSGIRGDNATTRSIQQATLEPMGLGYKLRFTEMRQGKPVGTVWKLNKALIIESASTGTAPAGDWNLVPYNREPPVAIAPTGKFEISMMVTSRSACTFAGTLQFLGNAKAQLFPGSAAPKSFQKSFQKEAPAGKIAEGVYWVGSVGMGLRVKGERYQFYDESGESPWKPISELTYIRKGVIRTGDTYWCLSTLPQPQNTRSPVCSAKGWVRSR
jgi:hypothetical protein